MRQEFIDLLKAEAGYREGQSASGDWNNVQKYSEETPGLEWSDGQPWCATFEAWGAHKLGMDNIWPMTASCLNAVAWWKQAGRWTEYPVLGGPFYLGADGGEHTGVVVAFDADTITTVEGNTNDDGSAEGNGVYIKTRQRRGPGSPYGYGIPNFPEGTVTADPSFDGAITPTVSLSNIIDAAKTDPPAPQGYASHPNDTRFVEHALVLEGLLDNQWASDGSFGSKTVEAYSIWQQRLGYTGADADGIPGRTSLTALGHRHGFIVSD